ncbi:MAG: 30S ribosomal protein S1 [Candidatus Sungbacteria bacterium]|nr:30S ribosomal protein S1 [Candidatus Sungbacteria bacterium]
MDISKEGRVSLSLKALKEDPWNEIAKKYTKGTVTKGVVSKVHPYGALVKLEEGVQGLVHISEFASEEDLKAKLQVGSEYAFEITQIAPEERRIALKLGG